jgi:putative RecB family exonuclease
MTCPLLYRFRVVDRLPERPSRAASRGTLVHAVLESLFDLPAHERTLGRATDLLPASWQRMLDQNEALHQLLGPDEPEHDPEPAQPPTLVAEAPSGPPMSSAPPTPSAGPVPWDPAMRPDPAVHLGDPPDPAGPPEPAHLGDPPDPGGPTAPAEPAAEPAAGPLAAFLAEAEDLLGRYFTLEDPSRLEPAERELLVSVPLPSGLLLRGIVDRIDVAPGGQVRVVDYKTGQAPSEVYEAKALFQMKFYALVLWRLRGTIPAMLQLVYLGGDGTLMRYQPEERDLLATERKLDALWKAIERAYERREFLPSPSRVCSWCDHHALCPAFDGTPPPLPDPLPVPAMESLSQLTDGPD